MKKIAPPPPDILRKSGPHKDKKKYDRKRIKQQDPIKPEDKSPPTSVDSASGSPL